MGLKKHMMLENGVQVNYHRVATIRHDVNIGTAVTVHSYTSQAKRRELDGEEGGEVYVSRRAYQLPYDDALTAARAYGHLKSLPEFEGAEDALEDD